MTYENAKKAMYKRDGWHCRHCNSSFMLTPHHIIHRSQGGQDDLDNLVTLCVICHNAHHDGKLRVWKEDGVVKFRRMRGWKP
jgi:5-methylcytosine-specific restriction endonuclease McrA